MKFEAGLKIQKSSVPQFRKCSFAEREAFAVCETLDPNTLHTKHIVDTGKLEHILRAPGPPHGVGVGVCRRRRCLGHFAVPHPILMHHVIHCITSQGFSRRITATADKNDLQIVAFLFANGGVMKRPVDVSSPMCALFFVQSVP